MLVHNWWEHRIAYQQILWTINKPLSANCLYFRYKSRSIRKHNMFSGFLHSKHTRTTGTRSSNFTSVKGELKSYKMVTKTSEKMPFPYLSHEEASVKSLKPSSCKIRSTHIWFIHYEAHWSINIIRKPLEICIDWHERWRYMHSVCL